MDNLCHTLMGAAIGATGLRSCSRRASGALMIAANVPDIDVLVFATSLPPVSFRRGWTHGVIAQLVLPVVVTAGVVAYDRWRERRRPVPEGIPLRPWWLLLLSYVGLYSHLALDLLNNYGVRVLAPLEWRWLYGDAVFIIDPWLWLALGASVWFARRDRRVAARSALGVALIYVLAMVASARLARGVVIDTWRAEHGAPPRELMVAPVPVTPFTKDVVIDAGDHYRTGVFGWWPRRLTLDDGAVPKNDGAPDVARARELSANIRGLLVWSRFPFWRLEPDPRGTRVTVADMRFGLGGRAGFAYSVIVPRLE